MLCFLISLLEAVFGADLGHAADPIPNILLVTLDTTRADHLPCYGYQQNTMPFTSQMATEQGLIFEHAFTPAPLTLPAHTSLLTGLTVEQHGVLDNGLFVLAPRFETLAESLKAKGYATHAYIAAAVLDRIYGLDQGFDIYDDAVRMGRRRYFNYKERAASQLVDTVLTQSKSWKSPWFTWVHFYDPHEPYVPPPPHDQAFEQPYDGELAFVDAQFHRMMASLRDLKQWHDQRDLAIIVGDHGEDLGDHGEMTHGLLLTPAALHVPLIWIGPGLAGKRTDQPISLCQIKPLLLYYLDAAGQSGPDHETRLITILNSPRSTAPFPLVTLMPYYSFRWRPLSGLLEYPWLFVNGSSAALFNIASDRLLKQDLSREAKHKARLRDYHAEVNRLETSLKTFLDPTIRDLSKLEELRSLGYVQSIPERSGPDPFSLPDPRERVQIYHEFIESKKLMKAGTWPQALERFESLRARDPDNTLVLNNLATIYDQFKRYTDAELVLLRVTEILPDMDYPYLQLGRFYMQHNHQEEARNNILKAITRNRRNAEAYLSLFYLKIREADPEGALAILRQALDNKVEDPELFTILAQHARSTGQLDLALDYVLKAEQLNPLGEDIAIEKTRIMCAQDHSDRGACFIDLKENIARYSWLADFWIVAADWYASRDKPGESYFCWMRAADRKIMFPQEKSRIRENVELMKARNTIAINPGLE